MFDRLRNSHHALAGPLRAVATAFLALIPASQAQAADRPNVLFILADDMGWMDSSAYGSKYYRTPELDRLMSRGVRFTRAYSASPICSPTRLSCMTGKYPARLKMTGPAGHLPAIPNKPYMLTAAPRYQQAIAPRSARFLPRDEYTLGEAFQDAGYRTGFVGKWHLGLKKRLWPEAQGFDTVFHGAPDSGPPSYFSPYGFEAGTVTDGPRGEYLTDRATDEAIAFLKDSKDGPWMLCLWHWAVHAPFQAPEELVEKYAGTSDPRGLQKNPTMAGMIESMDASIGVLLDTLDELGLTDDTIIVFFSDNGGSTKEAPPGEPPTSNAPLRNGKGSIYEGGTRVPAAIVWPGVVEAGSTSAALISSIDIYPTLLAMAGIPRKEDHLVDGISLVDTLRTGAPPRRDAIFCHHPRYTIHTKNRPATYVIEGQWKYIRFYDSHGPDGDEPRALYNLAEDVGERNNLWREMPERVAEMDALISQHLERIDAIELVPNPAYEKEAFNPLYDEPIDMWMPSDGCDIRKESGALHALAVGADAHFMIQRFFEVPIPCTVSFRARSNAPDNVQLSWSEAFGPKMGAFRTRNVELEGDGQWHGYSVRLDEGETLRKLRLGLARDEDEAFFDWIRVSDEDGEVVQAWEFEG